MSMITRFLVLLEIILGFSSDCVIVQENNYMEKYS